MSAAETKRIFIGMGSNLGDSPTILLQAWEMLGEEEGIHCVQLSSPYVTAPVDMYSSHWFTNAVGELSATLTPQELLERLFAIEAALGRVRDDQAFGFQDRVLDLDLIYFGDLQVDEVDLVLPHPHLQDRLFVLVPLVEIAPDFVDPRRKKTMVQLEARLRDRIEQDVERHQEISSSEWPNDK